MSGPKVSVYHMSASQRQNLRSQLSCLQQGIVCCEQIKESIVFLNGINGHIQSLLSTFGLVNQPAQDCSSEVIMLTDIQSEITQISMTNMEQLLSCEPILQVNRLDRSTLTVAELEKKQGALAKLLASQKSLAARRKEIEEVLRPMEEKARQRVSEVKNSIIDDISKVQSFFVLPVESDEERFMNDVKQLNEQLRALALDSDCPADLKGEVLSATLALSRVTSKEQLETFRSVTVKPLLQKIENVRLKVTEQKSEFNTLISRYAALCSIAGVQPEVYAVEINDDALSVISKKITAMEKQVLMQTEQEYISECVNEVMTEMGYDIIGNRSVTKRSGKRFRNELYSYGEGTAINITYDSDGQIAMELGGIDREDRIPTSKETTVLRGDMELFCSDFKDFEERLKAKGVVIKTRISMAPPTAEYATIINVSDYSLTETTPVKEITVKGRRSKPAVKSTLRREDN